MVLRFGLWFYFYIIIELVCCSLFIANQGFLAFFGEIFLSAIFGLWLARGANFALFFAQNPLTLLSHASVSFAGFLLFLPGIFCDILGVVTLLLSFALRLFGREKKQEDDDVIDVEIIEK